MSTQAISTKPYILRALHEWCTDSGYTPYIAVHVDDSTRVPRQYVKDSQIVLNTSHGATSGLTMSNELIEFNARFSGVSFKIEVPVANVLAIYAHETGEGTAFPVESSTAPQSSQSTEVPEPKENSSGKGFLKVVK